ncbi:MAG: hypothetical protein IKQ13_11200 [Treponema sp.]|nr:hypothetical protein [Treponema sp.]
MKKIIFIILTLFFVACSNEVSKTPTNDEPVIAESAMPEADIIRNVNNQCFTTPRSTSFKITFENGHYNLCFYSDAYASMLDKSLNGTYSFSNGKLVFDNGSEIGLDSENNVFYRIVYDNNTTFIS